MKKYLIMFAVVSAMLLAAGLGVVSAQTTYTVQYGDNLGAIAGYYGTSVQAIADANGLVNPNAIYQGQVLIIPDQGVIDAFSEQAPITPEQTQQYLVQSGDTISGIALRYSTTVAEIVNINGLYNPNAIFPGQVILVPAVYGFAPVADPAPAPSTEGPSVSYQTHTISFGETLFGIAQFYGVTVEAFMSLNGIDNANWIYEGQVLNIPGTEVVTNVDPVPAPVEDSADAPTPLPTGPWPTQTPTPLPTGPWPTETPSGDQSGQEGPWETATPDAGSAEPTPYPTGVWPTAVPDGETGDAGASEQPVAEVPAEPTEVPLGFGSPVGDNLLSNGGFEGGHYNHNGMAELQIPNGWRFEWKEGESGLDQPFFRPETRVLSKPYLPEHEHELFIYDGDFTVKVFKGYAPIDFSLLTEVHLEPGVYEMTVNVFADMVVEYTDAGKVYSPSPSAALVKMMGGSAESLWMYPTFGERNEIQWRFRVSEAGVSTVGANLRGQYGLLNNGFFLDKWSLHKVE